VVAATSLSELLTYPLVGLLAGLAIGLTGMGGGVLLTPIMVLFLGVPPNVAVSNDLLISLAIKPVGAVTHGRAGTVRTDIVVRLAAGSVPAAFLGALLVNTWVAGHDEALKYLIGGTLLMAAIMMVVRLLSRTTAADGNSMPPARTAPTVAIGVAGGLLVGMTSVGSGSLMLVLLSALYPTLASRTLVGTDLAQAIPLVAAAALGHVLFGDIHLSIVLPVLLGAFPGVWLGSRWSVRMPDIALRPTLLVLVGASGLRLVGLL
jgi:hypothetical protein